MRKIFLILSFVTLFASAAEEKKVITDPDKLREITDTFRSNSDRPKDFIPQGNGTVIDKRTGLQWMRCSLGQKWTGKTCSGKPSKFEWKDAMQQHPEFAGHADWRLPSIAELETLVYCRSGQDDGRSKGHLQVCEGENISPVIARQAFPNTNDNGWYWSLSPYADNKHKAWVVGFSLGFGTYFFKFNNYYVRLVRGGQ